MLKAFKYRLCPTRKQAATLQWILDRTRELYNAALQERKEAWRMCKKSISCYEQQSDLPEIKELREEYKNIYSQVLQETLKRVDKAFKAFFARCQRGDTPGFPRFQGRDRYDSFCYPQAGFSLTQDNKVCLSKVGSIKLKLHREVEGKIKTCTIKREGTHWYVVFVCEVETTVLPLSYEDVGIDLGLSHFATLSDGSTIENPRHYRRAEKKLSKLQQALALKKRGSHRRGKAKQDEEGKYLPNGGSAKSGLNKSITDAGWAMFVSMCLYKAEEAGRTLLQVNPRYTSQICSGCGTVKKKELSERWHSCECRTELDRDHNAAINILRAGRVQLGN